MATIVIFIPEEAQPSQTKEVNLTLISALYFPEIALKLVKWAEAFAMLVVVAQVDNAVCFWLPPNDTDDNAALVFETPVNFTHSSVSGLR